MSDGVIGLIGVLVGGVITSGTTFTMEYFTQHKEAFHLAHAFRGGVGALLDIVEHRQYLRVVEWKIQEAKRGATSPLMIKVRRDYLALFSKNVDRIGLLEPELAKKLPTFYTYVNSLLEDIDTMNELDWGKFSSDTIVMFLDEFRKLLVKTIALGEEIQTMIERRYTSPWPRFPRPWTI